MNRAEEEARWQRSQALATAVFDFRKAMWAAGLLAPAVIELEDNEQGWRFMAVMSPVPRERVHPDDPARPEPFTDAAGKVWVQSLLNGQIIRWPARAQVLRFGKMVWE